MTEDEAKTKACFKAATFGGSQQLAAGPGPLCIGSQCMAWRVRYMSQDERQSIFIQQLQLGQSSDDAWAFVNRVDLGDGYCGLAGPIQ